MKWLIASDLHGSAYYCRKLLEAYDPRQTRMPACHLQNISFQVENQDSHSYLYDT